VQPEDWDGTSAVPFSIRASESDSFRARLETSYSGCTSLALLDLKLTDLETAKDELIANLSNGAWSAPLPESRSPTNVPARSGAEVKILILECDVRKEDLVKAAFDQIIESFGRVDVTVACAGALGLILLPFRYLNATEGIVENYPALE
jgi:NAD(P)-dependent dehydrogenase (short-subunit alcohol dehydrogenase family)